MTGDAVLYLVAIVFAIALLQSISRRREAIRQKLRWVFMALGAFALTIVIVRQYTTDPIKILLSALLAELLVGMYTRPTRSRYIPRRERRKAIERYERSGRRFDPKRHHIDHIVPHARGGSNRADNLRVLEKETNLEKSDRSPWWDVFGR